MDKIIQSEQIDTPRIVDDQPNNHLPNNIPKNPKALYTSINGDIIKGSRFFIEKIVTINAIVGVDNKIHRGFEGIEKLSYIKLKRIDIRDLNLSWPGKEWRDIEEIIWTISSNPNLLDKYIKNMEYNFKLKIVEIGLNQYNNSADGYYDVSYHLLEK